MSGRQGARADMGWGYLGASGSSSGGGSSRGVNAGKKLYFEGDQGGNRFRDGEAGGVSFPGAPASSSVVATSAVAPALTPAASGVAAKRGKGAVKAGKPPPPRCQVEGCQVDLTGAKAYYYRHKVCGTHSKAPKVVVSGLEQRFCQQCSRFHQLAEFDQGKRSCRRRLAGHNERRRKPPPGSLPSCYSHLRASFHEDNGRHGGFLVDFSHPRLSGTAKNAWTTVSADNVSRGASSRYQERLCNISHSGIPTEMDQFSVQYPAGGSVFPAPKPPPSSSFEVSSSSCALSLLSTEARGASSSNRGPTISMNTYDDPPMAKAGASTAYTKSGWSFYENSSNPPVIPRLAKFGQATEQGDGDSSGELGVPSRGNEQCTDAGYVRVHAPGGPMN